MAPFNANLSTSSTALDVPHDVEACIALLSTNPDMPQTLGPVFRALFPNVELRFGDDLGRIRDIEAAVCWKPSPGLLGRLPSLKLIQSSGAGVDHILADSKLPSSVPICRIADKEMMDGMAAYVCWAVISHHRSLDQILRDSSIGLWRERGISPPSAHTIGILGTGGLGAACATALSQIGFPVLGWRRHLRNDVSGFSQIFHGDGQLGDFLSHCNTLVCLLPSTADTRGILCAKLFSHLPKGAHLINVGRGEHLVEEDLLEALDRGTIGAATLDTFQHEPLSADHAFWTEARIRITPHIATRPAPTSVAIQTLSNLFLIRQGKPPMNEIDRNKGY